MASMGAGGDMNLIGDGDGGVGGGGAAMGGAGAPPLRKSERAAAEKARVGIAEAIKGISAPQPKNAEYMGAVAKNEAAIVKSRAKAAELARQITIIVNSASLAALEAAYADATNKTKITSGEVESLYKEKAKLLDKTNAIQRNMPKYMSFAMRTNHRNPAEVQATIIQERFGPIASRIAEIDALTEQAYRKYFINNKRLFKFLKAAMGASSVAARISEKEIGEIDALADLMGGMEMGGGSRKHRRSSHRKSRRSTHHKAHRKSHRKGSRKAHRKSRRHH